MAQPELAVLEKKIRKAISIIDELHTQNELLQKGGAPIDNKEYQQAISRVSVLEKRIELLEEENQELRKKKEIIKDKVETMLTKYDILKL